MTTINNNATNLNLDYAEKLRDLSKDINKHINNFRDKLSSEDRRKLENDSREIRDAGIKLATKAAIDLLKSHQKELDQLLEQVNTANKFLNNVSQTKQIILAVSKVVDIAANIVNLIPPIPPLV